MTDTPLPLAALPLPALRRIAKQDISVYRGLLGLRVFAQEASEHNEVYQDAFTVCVETPVSRRWLLMGVPHRTGDRPAVEGKDGSEYYMVFGRLHRPVGAAIVTRSYPLEWWLDGVFIAPILED